MNTLSLCSIPNIRNTIRYPIVPFIQWYPNFLLVLSMVFVERLKFCLVVCGCGICCGGDSYARVDITEWLLPGFLFGNNDSRSMMNESKSESLAPRTPLIGIGTRLDLSKVALLD